MTEHGLASSRPELSLTELILNMSVPWVVAWSFSGAEGGYVSGWADIGTVLGQLFAASAVPLGAAAVGWQPTFLAIGAATAPYYTT